MYNTAIFGEPAVARGEVVATTSMWLRRVPGDQRAIARLLCFPHAGAGASSFNSWRLVLPGWVELVKAQLPGREDRAESAPFTRIECLLPELFAHVESLLDRPIAIYGHSMGAIVAFELARELRRCGHTLPIGLFVSGRRAPHRPLRRVVMHALPEPALIKNLEKLCGMSPAILSRPKWWRHYMPTLRADLEVSDAYLCRDEPPLDCPLHAFLGDVDELIPREDWEAWSEQAAGEFSRSLLPSGHILSRDARDAVLSKIIDVVTEKLTRDRSGGAPSAPPCA